MTFDEVQARKYDLQNDILKLVQQFEDATNAEVADIHLSTDRMMYGKRLIIGVKVMVVVP